MPTEQENTEQRRAGAGVSQRGKIATSPIRRGFAWSVHLFTACGVVCCLLALEATYASRWQLALAWLLLAVVIDGIDGTFARMARVKTVLPNFDGALLDNIIDFANYVIVPALIIHRAELVPASVSLGVASAICLSSCYQFCQSDAKTADHFFKGFPSYWNLVALYLLAMHLSPPANLLIVLTLVVLVFVPIKYIYVSRTPQLRRTSVVLTVVWAAMVIAIWWQLPQPEPLLVWGSMLYFAYYFVASLMLTLGVLQSSG